MTNKNNVGDIDIDIYNRHQLLSKLPHVPASIIKQNKMTAHNTGVYVQDIPVDPVTGLSSIDYEDAERLGFVKIDIINNNTYKNIQSQEDIDRLLSLKPDWDMLKIKSYVRKLPHIASHYDNLVSYSPKSIEDLATFIAMIRPAKSYLLNYMNNRKKINDEIWMKPTDGSYYFKKSHAIAYAMTIVMVMNKIKYDNIL